MVCTLLGAGLAAPWPSAAAAVQQQAAATAQGAAVKAVTRLNPNAVEVILADGRHMTLDFYAPDIVRAFRDDNGGIIRNPQATPPADILVPSPRTAPGPVTIAEAPGAYTVSTPAMAIDIDKATGLLTVTDRRSGRTVMRQTSPVSFDKGRTSLELAEQPGEYFFGGGVQNGRFSHKGRRIAIENQNSWTDGGVASPTPFYWSTGGYGLMFHTFAKGKYDFGAATPGTVALSHDTDYLDLFIMVDQKPEELLADFYQLTGRPVLLPKFGFYEGHLNAYNRDYWKEDTTSRAILFEDGKRYRESQRDNGGIRESLNGELPGNYQFSARAVIDRYAAHDMPLGWLLPNDGYGAGYGQTETLDGNIANLRSLGDYARARGVEIGLWTQSDLHPKEGVSPLLQRDIIKEVRDAGVRVLKTDVAWVGYGYSFGLNGVADVAQVMPYYGNDARPFIISLDGWAGTQRYAGVWSGDQTGGEWEYIRFHIPTYIGSGLSGQPNITSDMDGIFGGRNPQVNIRDFQWKTFTPMQLNMDGWGSNEKYPHALGEPAASINRNYLKLKSELMPYAYTYAREAVDGKPLIRAMMLHYPDSFTLSAATRYQFLYGPDFLVAPIYQDTAADSVGNDRRDGIYIPEGTWYDYFNGQAYTGPVVLNSFPTPIWKLPVFVRQGAIIPMANPTNNPAETDPRLRIFDIYPGQGELTVYDDDGLTQSYLADDDSTRTLTRVSQTLATDGTLTVTVEPTVGTFPGFEPEKVTEFRVNLSAEPRAVTLRNHGRAVRLTRAASLEEFRSATDVWFYNPAPELNRFSTPGTPAAAVSVTKNPQLMVRTAPMDVARTELTLQVKGARFAMPDARLTTHGALVAPVAAIDSAAVEAYVITPSWQPVANADYYEIEHGGQLYTEIRTLSLPFADLTPDTPYSFRVRAVNADGPGPWTTLTACTRTNPLEWAIRGIRGEVDVPVQPGFEVSRLFDFAESGDMWHTLYRADAMPLSLTADLRTINTLDRMDYLPRQDGGNGTLLRGNVEISLDKQHWTPVDSFVWARDGQVKQFTFAGHPQARYVRINATQGVGNYGAGRELYIFKVPGTESRLPGDINADGRIDQNDFMSYTNYTGLRRGDSDFEGYISSGDINGNGLIDAYDISVVATQLDDGVEPDDYARPLHGTMELQVPKGAVAQGDTITLTLRGRGLRSVNAFSLGLPYNERQWQFVGLEPVATAQLTDLTNNRLHTDGTRALYVTFVNEGERPDLTTASTPSDPEEVTDKADAEAADAEEPMDVLKIRFKALRRGAFTSTPVDGMLVDKKLNTLTF